MKNNITIHTSPKPKHLACIGILMFCIGLSSTPHLLALQEGTLYANYQKDDALHLMQMDMTSGDAAYIAELNIPEGYQSDGRATIEPVNNLYCLVTRDSEDNNRKKVIAAALQTAEIKYDFDISAGRVHYLFANPQDGLVYIAFDRVDQQGVRILSSNLVTGETKVFADMPSDFRAGFCSFVFDPVNEDLHALDQNTNGTENIKVLVHDLNAVTALRTYFLPEWLDVPMFNSRDGKIYGLANFISSPSADHVASMYSIVTTTGEAELMAEVPLLLEEYPIGLCGIGVAVRQNSMLLAYDYGPHEDDGFWSIRLEGQFDNYELPFQFLRESSGIYFDVAGMCLYPATSSTGGKEFVRVKGQVIAEVAGNCMFDDGDWLPKRLKLHVEPGGYDVYTGEAGALSVYLESGPHELTLADSQDWQLNCNQNSDIYNLNVTPEEATTPQLFIQPSRFVRRLDVSVLLTSPMVLGREVTYEIECLNSGTVPYTGVVKLFFDEHLKYVESVPAEKSVESGELSWTVENLSPGESLTIRVLFELSRSEELRGKTICVRAEHDRPRDDLLTRREVDESCERVRAAYDPNDITVIPAGLGDQGRILVEDSTLTYRIRFQNIGDAPARDVVILDTLDTDLDAGSIIFGAALHDYTVNVLNGNILEFRFEGIELPGKEEDEPNSHGAVKYKIDLKKDLPEGTQIHNRAGIYFDFNKPIITNTVVNTLSESITNVADLNTVPASEDKLELRSLGQGRFVCRLAPSPNSLSPSSSPQPLNGKLQVFSVLGIKVFETSLSGETEVSVDLGSQPGGRYFIRIEHRGAVNFASLLLAR